MSQLHTQVEWPGPCSLVQMGATSFAEDRLSERKAVGDLLYRVVVPAIDAILTHVEAPGWER